MNEKLHAPIALVEEMDTQKRTQEFADYILAVHEGKGMRYPLPQDDLQKVLEEGHGAPGEHSFIQTNLLFLRITREERPLFLSAIGILIDNPDVPEYTKAALLLHQTLTGFNEHVHPSVEKLLETSVSSGVLLESLQQYIRWKEASDVISSLIDQAPAKPPEKELTRLDYVLTEKELRFSPNRSRSIIGDWVMDHVPDVEDKYSFYPFGKRCDLEYRYLSIDIGVGRNFYPSSIDASWYDAFKVEDFLPVADIFVDTILPKEIAAVDYKGLQYDESPPGIYIYPDSGSLSSKGIIHIPFPEKPQAITYDLLVKELQKHEEFINYTLDECSINLLTPKGNQLHFRPHVPDDPDRHPINISFPQESWFFLQLRGSIPSEAVVSIIREGNRRNLPLQTVETILQEKLGK